MKNLITIEVKNIVEAPWNTRGEIDESNVRSLASSIKTEGLLSPLNVIANGAKRGKYICFDGCRRLAACKSLHMNTVECYLWDIDEADAKVKTVTANIQREADDPLMSARVICELLDAGKSVDEIAAGLGKSVAWVNRRRRLVAIAEEAKNIAGKVTIASLEKISALPEKTRAKVITDCENRIKWYHECSDANVDSLIQSASKDLDAAKFDKTACESCDKRTGLQQDLFGTTDGKLGKCLDCKCFDKTLKAWQNALIAKKVADCTETVKCKWRWQIPDKAKSDKPTRKCPCAYVAVESDGSVIVKYGPSKKVEDEAKKKAEDERRAERDARNAEYKRNDKIYNKFTDFFGVEENRNVIREKFVEIIGKCKLDDAQKEFVVDCIVTNICDADEYDSVADVLSAFPNAGEMCGIGDEDAKWFIERNKSND